MRLAACVLSLFFLVSPAIGQAAGLATSPNFSVMAPNKVIADAVVKQAESMRKEAALEWLGRELSQGQGPTMITVDISSSEDDGLTWPIDCPERKFHHIWLTTSLSRAVGTTLNHEVVHTVLESYSSPNRLPAWLREGVASQKDDADRKEIRQSLLAQWARDGHWPELRTIFYSPRIGHDDHVGYTVASSVTEFLAERGGKPRVIEFAAASQQRGWDRSAQDYYGFRNIAELQVSWQTWALNKIGKQARQPIATDRKLAESALVFPTNRY